jgi:plastocyanin
MSRNFTIIIAILLLVIIGSVALIARQRQTNTTTATTESERIALEETASPDNDQLDTATSPTVEATPTTTSTPSQTATTSTTAIAYDGSNFSPRSLTVAPGTTVTFTNNSSRSMWVASDPHPAHTNLSSFDADRAYAAGQSYTYTFDKAGTFTFHDHLNSAARGSIIVQ